MKKARQPRSTTPRPLPAVTAREVAEGLPKSATVNMRVTATDKASMERARASLKLSLTDYLLGCHRAVARHLGE